METWRGPETARSQPSVRDEVLANETQSTLTVKLTQFSEGEHGFDNASDCAAPQPRDLDAERGNSVVSARIICRIRRDAAVMTIQAKAGIMYGSNPVEEACYLVVQIISWKQHTMLSVVPRSLDKVCTINRDPMRQSPRVLH